MTRKLLMASPAGILLSCVLAAAAAPAGAQTAEVKEKPPLYTYVGSFTFPRAKWGDVAKQNAGDQKVFEKALANGSLIGYGDDSSLVHTEEGFTHDTFWSSMSMAGVLGVLDELEKSGTTTGSVLASSTKHEDSLLVSHYYNWKPGTLKGAYTHVASYTLKDGAPDNALDTVSKSFTVPLLEKLLADGTLAEYEVDEEAIHTEAPGKFWIVYLTKSAEGLDKVNAALDAAFGVSPFIGPALDSMVSLVKHRDELERTNAVYR